MIEWFQVTGECLLSPLHGDIKSFLAHIFGLISKEKEAVIFNDFIVV
jgi:hypothetical protein